MGIIIDVGGGGGGASTSVSTVPTFTDLPNPPPEGVGAERVTADSGVLYIWDGTTWNAAAGGGAVVSVNGQTGTVVLTTFPGLSANTFLFTDQSTNVVSYPGWQIDPDTQSSNVDFTIQPDAGASNKECHGWNVNIDPLQDSPDDSASLHTLRMNLDSSATGFNFGGNGQAATIIDGGMNYGGNGAHIGQLRNINFFTGLGDGTNPGFFKGLQAVANSLNASANITLDGPFNGYDFNLNIDAAAITTTNFSVIWGSDFSQLPVDVYGYQGLILQPNIATIKNNHNFNGYSLYPNITTFEGNAGYYGYAVGGNVTTLGTSGHQAFTSNVNITTIPATAGVTFFSNFSNIGTTAATSNVNGITIGPVITTLNGSFAGFQAFPHVTSGTGDIQLFQGSMNQVTTSGNTSVLNLSGQTADGKDSEFNADGVRMNIGGTLIPLSGQGIQSQHVIFTSYSQNGVGAITGTDILCNVLSPDVDFGTITDSVAAGPSLGTSAMVAFAGQLHGHGEMDRLSSLLAGAIFSDDFTLGEFRDVDSVMINAGFSGSITKATAFYHEVSGSGLFATTHWGLRVVTDGVENFVQRLTVGGTSQAVSNASVGIEIAATDKSLLVSRLTSAQETSLTPLNGMIIYNTDTNKFRGYENGVWTNLI